MNDDATAAVELVVKYLVQEIEKGKKKGMGAVEVFAYGTALWYAGTPD